MATGLTRDPHAEKHLLPPTRMQQDAYWLFRSDLSRAIANDIHCLRATYPRIGRALDNLETMHAHHPNTAFAIFRPEDGSTTTSAGDRVVLR